MSRRNSSIAVDAQGIAWIVGANTKVIDIVLDKLVHGWSPEEIRSRRPQLSLAQIHMALAYYHEHQAEIDREIGRQVEEVEKPVQVQHKPLLQKKPRWSDLPSPKTSDQRSDES